MSECKTCQGTGWVCEDHRDSPWPGLACVERCCGGAGAPCGSCNLEMASAGFIEAERAIVRDLIAVLSEISGRAPTQKPDGPYDQFGGYSSDDYGDVISDAKDEEAWQVAEIARAAISKAVS